MEIVAQNSMLPSFRELIQMLITFALTVLAWIFFRAASVGDAMHYIVSMFKGLPDAGMVQQAINFMIVQVGYFLPIFILFFFLIEWSGRRHQYALAHLGLQWPKMIRWSFYLGLALVILLFAGKEQQFIYFQF